MGSAQLSTGLGMSAVLPAPRVSSTASPSRKWAIRFVLLSILVWPLGFPAGIGLPVSILTVVGLAAAVAGLKNPSLGALAMGLLCTLEPMTQAFILTGGILRWNTVNYLLLIAVALNIRIIFARSVVPSRLLLLFLVVTTAGLLWTPNFSQGVQQLLEIFASFGILVYFWRAADDENIWKYMAFTNGTAAALGGLVFFARGYDLLFESSRTWGIELFFNPNSVAYLPLCGLFSICLGMRRASPRERLLLAFLAIVNCGWVFLGGSRGGILVAIVCIVFILLRMESTRLRAGFLTACLLIGVSVYVTFHDRVEHSIERIALLLDKTSDARSRTSGRSDLLIGGIRIFETSPWIGVGTGGFSWHWLRLRNGSGMGNYGLGIPRAAHSGWIRTLTENGLIGAAVHVGFVISFAVAGWRRRTEGRLLLGLFVTCVLALAYATIDMSGRGPWFLAMAAVAILYAPGPKAYRRATPRVMEEADGVPGGRHATG